MSRNLQNSKLEKYKTTLIKSKDVQSYLTQNTFYNPKTLKISIGAFNKSIEQLHTIQNKPLITTSQNHTLKHSKDNFPVHRHRNTNSSSIKDIPKTNYIINNFTLSTKNLINHPVESETNNHDNNNNDDQREKRNESLTKAISKKDKEIEILNQKLRIKDSMINEQKGKIDILNHKYSKSKKLCYELERAYEKMKHKNKLLEGKERDYMRLSKIIKEKKIYVELEDEENQTEGEGSPSDNEMVLQDFQDYLMRNEEGFTLPSMEYNDSSVFTPLTIDPVKSMKRLEMIPKLNFKSINAKQEEEHRDNKNNNNDNENENDRTGPTKSNIDNEHARQKTKGSYPSIHQEKMETIKADHKSKQLTQTQKSKSFTGKLTKMIKNDIYSHIQRKYNHNPITTLFK